MAFIPDSNTHDLGTLISSLHLMVYPSVTGPSNGNYHTITLMWGLSKLQKISLIQSKRDRKASINSHYNKSHGERDESSVLEGRSVLHHSGQQHFATY